MLLVVRTYVLCVKAFCRRKLIVKLNRTALPFTAKGINQGKLKLWTLEGTLALLNLKLKTR